MANLWVGTSGFSYRDWIGKFYPEDLPSSNWLEYYSQHFLTLELNNTFYRLPRQQTFINWAKRVPANFLFSVKANQRLTHLKKLKIEPEDWENFWAKVANLGKKLGVILFQLPPSFGKDTARLTLFLQKYKMPVRFAFEFRHPSWFDKEIFALLKAFNCALVFHDARRWPIPPYQPTADFVYLRFHGVETLFNYEYSTDQLKTWAKRIKGWLAKGLDVFAYFNNDVDAFAVKNARQLLLLCR